MTNEPIERDSVDVEKAPSPLSHDDVPHATKQYGAGYSDRWSQKLLTWGVEARGMPSKILYRPGTHDLTHSRNSNCSDRRAD